MNGRKFRKRPVVVDAQRFQNGIFTKAEWLEFCPPANIGTPGRSLEESLGSRDIRWFAIPTLEGLMQVSEGDYVVRGAVGEFYPVKPGAFAASFEPAYG